MRILVISEGRLLKIGSAGNIVMCGLVESALNLGYEVDYIGLVSETSNDYMNNAPYFSKKVKNLSQKIVFYKINSRNRIQKFCSNFDKSVNVKFLEKNIKLSYDKLIAFDSLSINFAKEITSKKYYAILGDPAGRKVWHFSKWHNISLKIKALLLDVVEPFYWKYRIPFNWNLAMFGTGHTNFWTKITRRRIIDLRPFIPYKKNIKLSNISINKNKIKVGFGGTLVGTASKKNLFVIFNKLIPILRKEKFTQFEIVLIGKNDFSFESKLYPEVKVLGEVKSFENILSSLDFFLIPSKYPVGVRTRICSALLAGSICIVHEAIKFNMPELNKCNSIFFFKDFSEVFNIINKIRLLNDIGQLRENSLKFFKQNYSAEISSKKLLI